MYLFILYLVVKKYGDKYTYINIYYSSFVTDASSHCLILVSQLENTNSV